MSSAFFDTSTIEWFRDPKYSGKVTDVIAAANIQMKPTTLIFRPNTLYDAVADAQTDVSGERLLRWDDRTPETIFRDGFQPRIQPAPGDFKTKESAFDLRLYVNDNIESVFVSTARYYRNKDKKLLRVKPIEGTSKPKETYFEYEIFGYGGIDVNFVLGPHILQYEHEIAFPGGIQPRFIRSAREYHRASKTITPVAMHFNPRFGVVEVPSGREVALTKLPTPFLVPGRTTTYYPIGAASGNFFSTQVDHSLNWDNLMHGPLPVLDNPNDYPPEDYEGIPDPDIKFALPFTCVSSFLDPYKPDTAYFFCWNQFVHIKAESGGTNEVAPQPIVEGWRSLVKSNFGSVDAIFPNPNATNQYFFFFREKCALVQIDAKNPKDIVITPPKAIADYWPSLYQAGFTTVDAVVPLLGKTNEAYVFSGANYVRISIQNDVLDPPNASIVYGPKKFWNEWPSLQTAQFHQINNILPHPTDKNQAYFFSGNSYALIHFEAVLKKDYIVEGPKLVYEEWPSLHKALFW